MPPIETKNSDILKSKKKISPADQLKQSIHDFLKEVDQISDDVIEKLIQEVPHKWERHGDLIIVPQRSLKDDSWKLFGKRFDVKTSYLYLLFSSNLCFKRSYLLLSLPEKEVYERICQTLKVKRIARKNPVNPNSYRSSNVELLWGENGIVQHTDNKIK